ncbi:hypothetical protein D1BOALGB6SA_5499 [Olavius sp. associated proteobacterium Delta 1]|nr:hypothetical protein D1BOALGB6SA_5499 [Olavius sp. associated proteobacterium Delta 1]
MEYLNIWGDYEDVASASPLGPGLWYCFSSSMLLCNACYPGRCRGPEGSVTGGLFREFLRSAVPSAQKGIPIIYYQCASRRDAHQSRKEKNDEKENRTLRAHGADRSSRVRAWESSNANESVTGKAR